MTRVSTAPHIVCMNNAGFAMLRTSAEFATFGAGASGRADALLSVRTRANGQDTVRVGLATGKVVGNAVIRNRVRRRLRETLRVLAPGLRPGLGILIIARPAAAEATSAQLRMSLEHLLR